MSNSRDRGRRRETRRGTTSPTGTAQGTAPPGRGTKPIRAATILLLVAATGFAAHHVWGHLAWGRHRDTAEAALARRDFATAADELRRCLERRPEDPESRLLLAQTTRRAGDLDGAARQLAEYERLGGSREAAAVERQLLLLQGGDHRAADDLARHCEARPEAPECPLILEALVEGSLKTLDLDRARSSLDLWVRRSLGGPERAQGLVWDALIESLSGDPEEAVALYRKAVELDPDHRTARISLAQLLSDRRPQEAAEHLEVLRQQHPRDAEVLFEQGRVLRSLGRTDEAARVLDDVLALVPNHVGAIVERGRIDLDLRRLDTAGERLRRAERLSPKHRDVLLAMVEYSRLTGATDEARRYQRRIADVEEEVRRLVERNAKRRREGESRGSGPADPGRTSRPRQSDPG